MLEQKIDAAADAKDEYRTLRIVVEENLLPYIEDSKKQDRITQEHYDTVKGRTEKVLSFFKQQIDDKEKELKDYQADKKRLESDC